MMCVYETEPNRTEPMIAQRETIFYFPFDEPINFMKEHYRLRVNVMQSDLTGLQSRLQNLVVVIKSENFNPVSTDRLILFLFVAKCKPI